MNYTNRVDYCSGFLWLRVRSSPEHLRVTWRKLCFYKISTLLNKLIVIIYNLTSSVYYKKLFTKPRFMIFFLFCICVTIEVISFAAIRASPKTGHRLSSHSTRHLSCCLLYFALYILGQLAVSQHFHTYRTYEKYSTEHTESFGMNLWFKKYQTL